MPPEVLLKFHVRKAMSHFLDSNSFPTIHAVSITLSAPHAAILLKNHDQQVEVELSHAGSSLTPERSIKKHSDDSSLMSISASLASCIWTSRNVGSHRCFLVQRQSVEGELVGLQCVTKSWMAALHFCQGASDISLFLNFNVKKLGVVKPRSAESLFSRVACRELR